MSPSPLNLEIDVSVRDARWSDALDDCQAFIENIVGLVYVNLLQEIACGDISVVLADDDFVQDLNKTYRDKDKPTNVLSFPQTDENFASSPLPFVSLGDIIVSYDTIAREAREQGKSLADHFTHMLVHGCLHLLHYDHQTDAQAAEMENLEIAILQRLGIKNPYET